MMEQNKAALVPDGSWRINTWASSTAQKFGFAPLPAGPAGRKTIINGIAPSISKDTKHPEESWKWVKFLTSDKCQSIVAKEAVVFPSIKAQSQAAADAHKAKGVDVSAYWDIAQQPDSLAYYPITFKADEINTEADLVIEQIERGTAAPSQVLPPLNDKINSILSSK